MFFVFGYVDRVFFGLADSLYNLVFDRYIVDDKNYASRI